MRLIRVWDNLRSSLWFRPAGWVVLSGLLAFVLLAIDDWTGGVYTEVGLPWYFRGGPDGARTILSIIGGGVLTVTSLTFSIIMVAVVQTANAYSPRMLSGYLAEPEHQHVLGILVGTFLYTLLVLWEVRSIEDGVHVPSLSITVAIILSLVSVGSFIFFIHYVSHSISVGNVVSLIMDETEKTLDNLFPENVGEAGEEQEIAMASEAKAFVKANGSGYVTTVDGPALMGAAQKRAALITLERTIGDYVLHGVPLAAVQPAEALDEELQTAVLRAFHLGKERTLRQDFLFGVRQLTDIALRALSPGINDPSTAEQCIDALVNLLSKLSRHTPISPYRRDDDGGVRLIATAVSLSQALALSFGKIRYYGSEDLATTLRLIRACGELGYATEAPAERAALWSHVVMMANTADRTFVEKGDRQAVNESLARTAGILGQDVEPLLLA